jgi:hypothetical protein
LIEIKGEPEGPGVVSCASYSALGICPDGREIEMRPAVTLCFAILFTATASPLAIAQAASQKMFFEGDMVVGAGPGVAGPTCVLNSQYRHGQIVVWRVRIQDQTGKRLTDKDVRSAAVELPDGQKFALHYGPHPKGKTDDYFWSASWKIPDSYPTGTFAYKVVATGTDGQTQDWSPFNVALSQLTIVK